MLHAFTFWYDETICEHVYNERFWLQNYIILKIIIEKKMANLCKK